MWRIHLQSIPSEKNTAFPPSPKEKQVCPPPPETGPHPSSQPIGGMDTPLPKGHETDDFRAGYFFLQELQTTIHPPDPYRPHVDH
jgi:hypothetical protein